MDSPFDKRRTLPTRRTIQASRSIPQSPHFPVNRRQGRPTLGGFLLSIVRALVARYRPAVVVTPEEEVDAFLRKLRAASRADLASALAAAMLARKTLDTTRMVTSEFPLAFLDGQSPVDDAAREHLRHYGAELRKFQKECAGAGTILGIGVARGLDTWIVSIDALAEPALLDKGREIWALLAKGEDGAAPAYRFAVRRDLTEIETTYLAYRPAAFLSR